MGFAADPDCIDLSYPHLRNRSRRRPTSEGRRRESWSGLIPPYDINQFYYNWGLLARSRVTGNPMAQAILRHKQMEAVERCAEQEDDNVREAVRQFNFGWIKARF